MISAGITKKLAVRGEMERLLGAFCITLVKTVIGHNTWSIWRVSGRDLQGMTEEGFTASQPYDSALLPPIPIMFSLRPKFLHVPVLRFVALLHNPSRL